MEVTAAPVARGTRPREEKAPHPPNQEALNPGDVGLGPHHSGTDPEVDLADSGAIAPYLLSDSRGGCRVLQLDGIGLEKEAVVDLVLRRLIPL